MDPDKECPVVNVNAEPKVDIDDATANPPAALMNPVIMDMIFGYLTVSKVKDARRVCKIWESVGTGCLGRRCSLSINNFFGRGGKLGSDPTKDQLVRSVKFSNQALETDFRIQTGDKDKRIDYDFLAFVVKYQEQIEEIIFNVDRHFAPTIKWVLENLSFSELKSIRLLECDDEIKSIAGCGLDYFEILDFRRIPTLKTLKMGAPKHMKGRDGGNRVDERDGYPYYQIVQEIINKSPNLEKLFIEENFYPDLSYCRKLKVLDYKGYPFKPFPLSEDEDDDEQEIEIREDFSMTTVFKMLDQVKDCLEELVIGTADEYGRTNLEIPVLPDVTNVKFPCFPCLKALSIYPIDCYMFEFEKVTEDQLPRLQKLTLQELEKEYDCLDQLLLNWKTCWTNVEYLFLASLLYQHQPGVRINQIVKTFPNTTKFHLWIYGNGNDDELGPITVQRFKEDLMEIGTANWNIQHLEIGIEFSITLSELMDALCEVVSVNGFKYLKTLKLTSTEIHDGGCDNFEKPLMALRNITFDQIKFERSTLIKMVKFIDRNDLKIHFMNVD